MAATPLAIRELIEAWRREDLRAVGGIIDWLEATLEHLG